MRRSRPLGYERRILLIAAATLAPLLVAVAVLLFTADLRLQTRFTLALTLGIATLVGLLAIHTHLTYPLRTLSNLLAALREEDYSIRARGPRSEDALGEVMVEVNELGTVLREQRLGALEASALLRTVVAEIDAAIFTFDGERRLKLVNRAGERLLASNAEALLGRTADELGLAPCLEIRDARAVEMTFRGATGRWGIRTSTFRESGRPHQLLLITDLSQALRDEERQAWQRLVRVLSHELNNSLTPIKSIAASLLSAPEEDWSDVQRGLTIISARAESLTRFMDAYTRLARLPRPRYAQIDVGSLVTRVAQLERRIDVRVEPGPAVVIDADGDQLEQLVINLVRNAVDAGGPVIVTWRVRDGSVEVVVTDEGPGLSGTSNLFVPFFTTKPGGTGIGLVLSRQIADAHGGSLSLENRDDGPGCVARLRVPLRRDGAGSAV
jgi:nitrogen fixation/metabolism regulation signal transduction histidine kinase